MYDFPSDGPVTASIHTSSGSCTVVAGGNTVTVQAEPSMAGRKADRRAAEATEVSFDGRRLRVEVPNARAMRVLGIPGGRVRLTIALPAMSAVEFDTSSADLEVRGPVAVLRADTNSGQVQIDEVRDEAKIDSSSGKVAIGRLVGQSRIKTGSGDIRIERADGPLNSETSSGKTQIGTTGGDTLLRSSSGDLQIGKARGNVRVDTSSGRVKVGVGEGLGVRPKVTTSSGSLRGDLAQGAPAQNGIGSLTLEIKTSSGDIDITRA